MNPRKPVKNRRSLTRRGFALVITIMMLVMLTLLVVGLLTLSTVTLRSGTVGQARAEAKANARLALMLAIGELQKSLGPDQSVSARASSVGVESNGKNFTGAWKAWHWQPFSSGPSYSEKTQRFERWLASSPSPADARDFNYAAEAPANPVWLINPKTVPSVSADDTPGLQVSKVDIDNGNGHLGAFAWGVMDESAKAPFQLKDAENPTPAQVLAQRFAPSRANPESVTKGLDPKTLQDPQKLVSLNTAVVAAGKSNRGEEILGYQQDVTPYTIGLMTDTARGGLKKDLTTMLESSDDLSAITKSAYLYPDVSGNGVPMWDYLRSHYQSYNRITGADTRQPTLVQASNSADLKPASGAQAGLVRNPNQERLLPVVLRFQIMFSAVSHDLYLGDRINFYNSAGGGASKYAAPNLVYDPVITLYNPYDVALTLQKVRVRVWDPPVIFGFKKNGVWLRDEYGQGSNGDGFQGLARFQIANERTANARRYFTMILGGGNSERVTGNITLQPGEVRAFSPRIQKSWSWGTEIAGGTNPQVFFDWNAGLDFGNRDARTANLMGVEGVAGWDVRAGLQTDHLSYSSGRPAATHYSFETPGSPGDGGWLSILKTDRFVCSARPGKTVKTDNSGFASDSDFRVDLLAGTNTNTNNDILRSYRFKFKDPIKEISESPSNPIITRDFRVGDILQKATEPQNGGAGLKLPFALLTMEAKTTADVGDNDMPWLFNQPVVEGVAQDSSVASNALDSYSVKLMEVADFNDVPNGIQCDKNTGKTYYGASVGSDTGSSNVPMFHVPVGPAVSLGDLIPANLVNSASLPRVSYALGSSRANPLIKTSAISNSLGGTMGTIYDQAYLMNDALWDSYFFSTVAKFSGGLAGNTSRSDLLKAFFDGDSKLLNSRLTPLPSGTGSIDDRISSLDGMDTSTFSRTIAANMGVKGVFNVNSDSEAAWKAMLASLREQAIYGWGGTDLTAKGLTPLARTSFPVAGEMDTDPDSPKSSGIPVIGKAAWAGFRAMNDDQIEQLAKAIVVEVRARGKGDRAPSATLGEFINRHLGGGSGLHEVKGLLETAIEKSKINDRFLTDLDFSRQVKAPTDPITGLAAPAARVGYTAEGAPPSITQGDLLMALAPVITVRGDTFRIRTYGETRDGDNKIVATAWCEAVVQRLPDYVDPANKPEDVENLKPANQTFGRQFVVVSFRWLSPEEV